MNPRFTIDFNLDRTETDAVQAATDLTSFGDMTLTPLLPDDKRNRVHCQMALDFVFLPMNGTRHEIAIALQQALGFLAARVSGGAR